MATSSLAGRYHPRDNLLVVQFPHQAALAGVTTQSSLVGAPVTLARERIPSGSIDALIVNAGNANVFTGQKGMQHTRSITSHLATILNCRKEHTLMASTGVIGELLDPDLFSHAFNQLRFDAAQNWQKAATAIMTTDTYPKAAYRTLTIDDTSYHISGIAKGSGMVAPHMATTLLFLFTDLSIPANILQNNLSHAISSSFNAISVDGDTSTSDMALAMASHASPPLSQHQLEQFAASLHEICHELALCVVRDGEGITKCLEIRIEQAKTHHHAEQFARSIAHSPLVKTAIYGEDLNWGRIAMALGKTEIPIDEQAITISFGNLPVYQKGNICHQNIAACRAYITNKHVILTVALAQGTEQTTLYTTDLSHDYITINAHYRS